MAMLLEGGALDNSQNEKMAESSLIFGHPQISPVGNGPAAPSKLGRLPSAIDRMAYRLSSLMANSINRYPDNFMELYSWIFESLDLTESKELLQQWIPAIEGEQPPLFHQHIQNWPPIKDSQGILLYILCGNHGRNLPLGKLYTSMNESSVHPATKAKLGMAMALRKSQLQRSTGSLSLGRLEVPAQSLRKETESFVKVSPAPVTSHLAAPILNASEPAALFREDSGCLTLDKGALLERQDCGSRNNWTQYSCHVDEAFPGFCHQRRPPNLQHSASATVKAESSPFSVTKFKYHKRPFVCAICDKGFKERRKLDDHIRTHTGEKPFRCSYPQCGRLFNIRSNKRRHERTRHKDFAVMLPLSYNPQHESLFGSF